jgi:hypothetical protein
MGQLYLQEWSSGEAEDATKMVSTSYGLGSDSKPHAQDLAESPLSECLILGPSRCNGVS